MTAETITLRAADPGDAGRLGAMITEAVQARAWKPRLHSAAQDISHAGTLIDRGWVTVAELGPEVAGFLAREGYEIHALFVAGWAQGRRLGSTLLDHAKTRADRLELWTFQQNEGAQRFYLRHGFAETRRTNGDNEEGLPDIHYLWRRDAGALQEPVT